MNYKDIFKAMNEWLNDMIWLIFGPAGENEVQRPLIQNCNNE